MKTHRPEMSLEHVLSALERELIAATDEEVLAAAAELGMNPSMKGSAAFMGVKSPLVRLHVPEDLRAEEPDVNHQGRSDPRGS